MVQLTQDDCFRLRARFGPSEFLGHAILDLHKHGVNSVVIQDIEHPELADIEANGGVTTQSIIDRVAALLDYGKQAYNDVAQFISQLAYQILLSVTTTVRLKGGKERQVARVPDFLESFIQAAQDVSTATGRALRRAVNVLSVKMTQFWVYLEQLFEAAGNTLSGASLQAFNLFRTTADMIRGILEQVGARLVQFFQFVGRGIATLAAAVFSLVERAATSFIGVGIEVAGFLADLPERLGSRVRQAHRSAVEWIFFVFGGFMEILEWGGRSSKRLRDRLNKFASMVEKGLVRLRGLFAGIYDGAAEFYMHLTHLPIIGSLVSFFGLISLQVASVVQLILRAMDWAASAIRVFKNGIGGIVAGLASSVLPKLSDLCWSLMERMGLRNYADTDIPSPDGLARLAGSARALASKTSVPQSRQQKLKQVASDIDNFIKDIEEHTDRQLDATMGRAARTMWANAQNGARLMTKSYFDEDITEEELDQLYLGKTGMKARTFAYRTTVLSQTAELQLLQAATEIETDDERRQKQLEELDRLRKTSVMQSEMQAEPIGGIWSWMFGKKAEEGVEIPPAFLESERWQDDFREFSKQNPPRTLKEFDVAIERINKRVLQLEGETEALQEIVEEKLSEAELEDDDFDEISAATKRRLDFEQSTLKLLQRELTDKKQLLEQGRSVLDRAEGQRQNRVQYKNMVKTYTVIGFGAAIILGAYLWYRLHVREQIDQQLKRMENIATDNKRDDVMIFMIDKWKKDVAQRKTSGEKSLGTDLNDHNSLLDFIRFSRTESRKILTVDYMDNGTRDQKSEMEQLWDAWGVAVNDRNTISAYRQIRAGKKLSDDRVWYERLLGQNSRTAPDGAVLDPPTEQALRLQLINNVFDEVEVGIARGRARLNNVLTPGFSNYIRNIFDWTKGKVDRYTLKKNVKNVPGMVDEFLDDWGASNVAGIKTFGLFVESGFFLTGGTVITILTVFFGMATFITRLILREDLDQYATLAALSKSFAIFATSMSSLWGPIWKRVLANAEEHRELRQTNIFAGLSILSNLLFLIAPWSTLFKVGGTITRKLASKVKLAKKQEVLDKELQIAVQEKKDSTKLVAKQRQAEKIKAQLQDNKIKRLTADKKLMREERRVSIALEEERKERAKSMPTVETGPRVKKKKSRSTARSTRKPVVN